MGSPCLFSRCIPFFFGGGGGGGIARAIKHHLARTHKIYWSFPPSPHTNVDNVMQNTVQAFGRFLKQHRGGGKVGKIDSLSQTI